MKIKIKLRCLKCGYFGEKNIFILDKKHLYKRCPKCNSSKLKEIKVVIN